MATVKLKNLFKKYDESEIFSVNNADFTIADKEFVVLVGPSGCGKSTTLRMIAGLETITDGQIFIDDELVNDIPSKDRNIAMVFQNYALYPHMTVFDNMGFGLKIRKFPKKEIEERVNAAAKTLDISELLKRKPKQLSGGQRQRVAVGRAIVRQPKVFLFDEPLSNLDAKLRVQMRSEIISLHRRLEATMVYVTHDQVEAMTMGDRIVVMKDGFIQQIGTPLELYNTPKNLFVAGFIGSPPMNFINVKIVKKDGKLHVDAGVFSLALDKGTVEKMSAFEGKSLIMGLRPEDIHDNHEKTDSHPGFNSDVDIIEPLGAETYVHFKTGGIAFMGKFRAITLAKAGSPSWPVAFDMSKARFFDPAQDSSPSIF